MNELIMNATPVRTSRNFNINNVKLSDIDFPAFIDEFSSMNISNDSKDIMISDEVSNINLKYGVNEVLTSEIENNSNKKLKITVETKEGEKTYISFNINSQDKHLFENIEICAKKNSNATIIIKYENEKDEYMDGAIHNGIIRANLEEKAKIDIIILNILDTQINNFLSIENNLQADSELNFTIIDFGAKNTILNYYTNLRGDKSSNNLNTIYLGGKDQFFDFNYIIDLIGEKTAANIESQGALQENAKKHFKGTLNFKKGCKKSVGNENEYCALLSDNAKSISLPMLLCSEEDVIGNHSSSAGKIEENELFYIMSRGFTKKEATKLIIRANFNKILKNINDDEILKVINDEIDKKLE